MTLTGSPLRVVAMPIAGGCPQSLPYSGKIPVTTSSDAPPLLNSAFIRVKAAKLAGGPTS